jgi:predicted nuclease with TOPRIM domain
MTKNILTITALSAVLLFSCGDTNSQEEQETLVNEIENVSATADSLSNEIQALEEETSQLDELVNEL